MKTIKWRSLSIASVRSNRVLNKHKARSMYIFILPDGNRGKVFNQVKHRVY